MRPASNTSQAKVRGLLAKGLEQHRAGRMELAHAAYSEALQISPREPDALHMLGVAEFQLGRFNEAERLFATSLEVAPRNALACFNHGNALLRLGRLAEAGAAFARAGELDPGNADALMNLGNVYKEQNRFDDAIGCYDRVLSRHPTHADARYNKALALLTLRRLGEAWELYESRLQCDTDDRKYLGHSIPRQAPDWDGSLPSKPLLVLPEQGLGDQIFYGGMLPDLAAAGVESFVSLDERLLPLFRRSFPHLDFALPSQIAALDPAQGLFGAQLQMASMGRWLRSSEQDLQRVRSPYLIADRQHAASLRARLARPGRLLCGLSWASRNAAKSASKSVTLQHLLPLLQLPNADFVDLQYGDTDAERSALRDEHGIDIRRLHEIDNLNDIDGLAALIEACDIVVTISNSTAHLAAALGKPVIVLLPWHPPLWYWHQDAMDSPWYPSAILLRQQEGGDWATPVASAAKIVRGLAG